jgi:hypothetical protein
LGELGIFIQRLVQVGRLLFVMKEEAHAGDHQEEKHQILHQWESTPPAKERESIFQGRESPA